MEILEERLRGGSYAFGDATKLCMVPNVVKPPKFKEAGFEKFKRVTFLKNHLTMWCGKMVAHAYDEKLLIFFFSR